jgi:hypothetical protein
MTKYRLEKVKFVENNSKLSQGIRNNRPSLPNVEANLYYPSVRFYANTTSA